jgi:hypothetical protein
MRYSSLISAVAVASSFISAAPIEERAAPAIVVDYNVPEGGDITILNYALILEYLERAFYKGGLAKFSAADFANAGFDATFYTNLEEIAYDEVVCYPLGSKSLHDTNYLQTHVDFLAGALGAAGVKEAQYKFPYTDPKSFVALASVLEGVGVSAYLGAAAEIADKSYLTIAGSILTVKSRHSSYIRAALKESPFPKRKFSPYHSFRIHLNVC